LKFTVLYNNIPLKSGFQTGWGFSCLVQGLEKTILFDTGGNGGILHANMRTSDVDPAIVDLVVLSHNHGDHAGGLGWFLKENPRVTVYTPTSFSRGFQEAVNQMGAKPVSVSAPGEIVEGVFTTGDMGGGIIEQALILESTMGLVLITGCAHPGIVQIAEKTIQLRNQGIYLVVGGFHLMGYGERDLRAIAERLKEMGVKRIAPSHCTGDLAMAVFKGEWKAAFLDGGCGAVITVP